MEHEELSLLVDLLNNTEQDHKVDEGDADMEVSPTDQLVIVPEAMIAPATGNQGTSGVEEERETEKEEDDLDTIMLDMTMVIAKAKKAGDLVAIIACPHGDHKVDLKV